MRLIAELRAEFEQELRNRMVTFISTALGVVVALLWQTAIIDTIKAFIPINNGAWQYELVVALQITIVAVFVLFLISRTFKINKK
jgi:hypothetical protein